MITCILAHLLDICKSHRYSGPKGGPVSLIILNLLDNLKSPRYSGPMKHNLPGYFANLFNIHESTGYSWMSWKFGAYEARISWIFEAYEVLLSRHSVNLLHFQGLWSLNLLDIRGQWITNHPHICEYQEYSGQGLQSTNHLYICEHLWPMRRKGIFGASKTKSTCTFQGHKSPGYSCITYIEILKLTDIGVLWSVNRLNIPN